MDKQASDDQPLKKSKLYKWLAVLPIIVVLILITAYIFSRLNHPVTAQVKATQWQASSTAYNIDLTPTPMVGSYVSFDYPRGLHLVSTALVSVPSVEDFTYYAKDISSWTLAIDIARTPTGVLTESSSYTLRKDNPQAYSESFTTVNGQSTTVMTDTTVVDGFSKVAYLTHGNLVATVSLIGNDAAGTQPLQITFAMVLNSWRWL